MAFDPNHWTRKTTEAVQAAMELARSRSNPEVVPAHLLLAMIGQAESVVLPVLQRVGVAPASLKNTLDDQVASLPSAYGGGDPTLSRDLRDAFDDADKVRSDLHDDRNQRRPHPADHDLASGNPRRQWAS